MQQSEPDSLNLLFRLSCRKYAARTALGFAGESKITYGDLYKKVAMVADYLKQRGVSKGERLALLGENSPNWCIAYFAIISTGASVVPILPDFPEADIRHILSETEVRLLFATSRQLEKVDYLAAQTPLEVVLLDGPADFAEDMASIEHILAASGFVPPPLPVVKLAAADDPGAIASIIYTSGTSGHSKAVMLSHENFCANLRAAQQVIPLDYHWKFLSILPLSHAYEFTIGLLLPLSQGAAIVYAKSRPTPSLLGKICEKEHPSVICVVPVIVEKIYKKKVLPIMAGKELMRLAMRFRWLRKLVLKKIGRRLLEFFGGNLRLLAIGGAALNSETERFLCEAGLPYLVGYGLTESAPLLAGGPYQDPTIALGSVGKPISNVAIKIANRDEATGIGEIVARGPNIMRGYFKNPELTAEVIDPEGWLRTGDLGFLDDQGNLHLKGRRKNVIVPDHGENVYPEAIEDKLNGLRYVAESLVLQSGSRLEAMVYLDYDVIDQETRGRTSREVQGFIAEILVTIQKAVNAQLPAYSRLNRIVERPEPFVKTATQKIKRYLYTKQ